MAPAPAGDDATPIDPWGPAALGDLDATEVHLARLVAAGLSDAEIASRLGMGVVDVQAAVGGVVDRLHIRSRSELALLATDNPGDRTRWTPRAR